MDQINAGMKTVELVKKEFLMCINKIKEERPEIFNDALFGVWVTTALADLLCASGKALGAAKGTLIKMIDEGWNYMCSPKNILN